MSTLDNALRMRGWSYSPTVSETELGKLIRSLGKPISLARRGPQVVDLRPYDELDAPAGSMSSKVGLGEQPLHTDGAFCQRPPRYLVMHCLDSGEGRCPTRINQIDWQALIRDRPSVLIEPTWIVQGGGWSPFYSQVLLLADGQDGMLRFDPCCMRPVSSDPELPARTLAALDPYVMKTDVIWNEGGVLIIDNWRCLHGRHNAVNALSRVIRRWTLETSNGLDR